MVYRSLLRPLLACLIVLAFQCQLRFFLEYTSVPSMVQRCCAGEEFSIDVFCDWDARCLNAIPRTMIESKGGESIKGRSLADLIAFNTRVNVPPASGWAEAVWLATRGWALSEQGHGEQGLAQMRRGLAFWQATGAELVRPHCLAMLAETYGKVGHVEEGLSVLAEALAAVAAPRELTANGVSAENRVTGSKPPH